MCILAFFLKKKCKAFSKFSKLYMVAKGLRTIKLEIIPEDTEWPKEKQYGSLRSFQAELSSYPLPTFIIPSVASCFLNLVFWL